MNTAAEVLLIIVSGVLAVFLIVLGVALVYFIGVLKQVKRITERAENVAGSLESAAAAVESTAPPLAVLKLIGNIVETAGKFGRRKR